MPSTPHAVSRLKCALAILFTVSCGGKVRTTGELCGPGTHDALGSCVPDLTGSATCGPGTYFYNGKCVLNSSGDPADAGAPDVQSDPIPDVNTACLVKDNIFVIAGDDFVHTGPAVVIEGGVGWVAGADSPFDGQPSEVGFMIGNNWTTSFSTRLLGHALVPGTYTDARLQGSTIPNHPGLDVSGDGHGCNTVSGQFTVIEMSALPPEAGGYPQLQSFTVVFEQHCNGGPKSNVGCLHVTM